MSGTDSLLKLVASFEEAGIPYMIVGSCCSNFYAYIRRWCAEHGTLEWLEEAKAEAAVVWEADELEGIDAFSS